MRSRHLSMLLILVLVVAAGCSGERASEDAEPTADNKTGTLERYAGYSGEVYGDDANWLCRPDNEDICDSGLDSTTVDPDGTRTVETWRADPEAPIDCFYVYPTVSRDPGRFSDRDASPGEEGFAALNQVARLGQTCRVFAPIYRQGTLTSLAGTLAGGNENPTSGTDEDPDTPFNDVLDAWKTYMANDNQGRGVVLVGHSQGAALLNRLIKAEIDPNDDVRDVFVSAYLAGWSVRVPPQADVGGDFANIKLCREDTQIQCVVTWSSYRSTVPPVPGSIFGRSSTDPESGAEFTSGCTSPASLAGGSAAARSYFPTDPDSSLLGALGVSADSEGAARDSGPDATPFVSTPGLVSVECRSAGGFNYLELTVHGDPADPRIDDIGGDLSPEWGMHLQDVNVVMGNIVELVTIQAKAFSERR